MDKSLINKRNRESYARNKNKRVKEKRIYNEINRDKINERQKLYRKRKRDELLKKEKLWRELNKNKVRINNQNYYQKNKERLLAQNKMYRMKNKTKLDQNKTDWNKKNRGKQSQYNKRWQKRNPNALLQRQLRYLKKHGGYFNINSFEYKMALRYWGKIIKKRDKACVVCGSVKDLNAHHIIHRSVKPELTFVFNNGITLCRTHHNEAHEKNLIHA